MPAARTASPQDLPPALKKQRRIYKQRALIAMAGLVLFVAFYFFLAGWFSWTAYHLFFQAPGTFVNILCGLMSGFLALFTIKSLFHVQHNTPSSYVEITAQQEPTLFAFLYRLADLAGAPRPKKVFLSNQVNAAVFYDVSFFNLIFPSEKNLVIGLGLVNVLTLAELKAVLAHEFGHFAQRSTAIGRWVYLAQQVTAHIVMERDALDGFLKGLSRIDIRIAWVGWILSLIVWSIRSLLETAFKCLILVQRALSREMEFQADLVAVSLTGSDAIVHALYRIHAADEAWARTLNFAASELKQNRLVEDLFDIQTSIIERYRVILDDEYYGAVPPPPRQEPRQTSLVQIGTDRAPSDVVYPSPQRRAGR